MKLDKVKIGKIISDIRKYEEDLDKLNITLNALHKREKFYTSSMLVFSMLTCSRFR